MDKLIKNFNKMYGREDLFVQANSEQVEKLINLFGDKVYKIIEFYSKYQPDNLPMLDSYVRLLGIDSIIEENKNICPGIYLSKYGVYVFATTAGGHGLCIDTNDVKNGDASVLIADHDFCSYNELYDCVEIQIAPDKVFDKLADNEILPLNYPNIKKSLPKIESSFIKFMKKLSMNRYEDIEEYLL